MPLVLLSIGGNVLALDALGHHCLIVPDPAVAPLSCEHVGLAGYVLLDAHDPLQERLLLAGVVTDHTDPISTATGGCREELTLGGFKAFGVPVAHKVEAVLVFNLKLCRQRQYGFYLFAFLRYENQSEVVQRICTRN